MIISSNVAGYARSIISFIPMKRSFYIFLLALLSSSYVFSQEQKTIVDDLNTSKWGQGKVVVMQDEMIEKVVAVRHDVDSIGAARLGKYSTPIKGGGYKIQVFMGNNQQQSKREAESKQSQIRAAFPELRTEVKFQSPFWRLRVINFPTREDADEVLKVMQKEFPAFAKEMYIVAPNR